MEEIIGVSMETITENTSMGEARRRSVAHSLDDACRTHYS